MGKGTLRHRLQWYWKMEAGCGIIIPMVAFAFAPPREAIETAVLLLALVPTSVILIIGAGYWRAVIKNANGDRRALHSLLGVAAKAERLLLLMIVCALLTATIVGSRSGWPKSVIAALLCSLLAALEFINYFWIQLQHFDHLADFQRLIRGRGFKKAHLARDLAVFRANKS